MKLMKRLAMYYEFLNAQHMVLFATDVVSRGLDFQAVDWVVQGDCPEDVPTYIVRVGRTARITSSGKGLLLLAPSEMNFLDLLARAKVPIRKVTPSSAVPGFSSSVQCLLSKDNLLKEWAQRALKEYLRFTFMLSNKKVFDIRKIDVTALSASMGLSSPPVLQFMKQNETSIAAKKEKKGTKDISS